MLTVSHLSGCNDLKHHAGDILSENENLWRSIMEMSRILGIGVIMIVPAFVGSGAVWQFFGSWIGVLIWLIIMGFVYGTILSKKNSPKGA